MPVYRVRYRPITDPESAWSTYVDSSSQGAQTDGNGRIDTGATLGGSVTVPNLTNGTSYQFTVDRLDGGGNTVTSAAAVTAVPAASVDETATAGAGSTTSSGGDSGQLATRNGVAGMYVTFSNASWQTARVYFRPRTEATFPGYVDGEGGVGDAANLTVSRQPFVVSAASVTGSGDASTTCFKVSNQQLFVPFDYAAYDVRVAAQYNAKTNVITLESPTV